MFALTRAGLLLIFILFTVLKQAYFHYSTGINTGSVFEEANFLMLLALLAAAVLIAALFSWTNRRNLARISFAAAIIISALMFSDTLYFRYYNNILTIPLIYQLGMVDSIKGCVFTLMRPEDFLLFSDVPLYLLLLKRIRNETGQELNGAKKLVYPAGMTGIGLALLLIMISGMNNTITSYRYDSSYVIKRAGITNFHVADTANFVYESIFRDRSLNDEELGVIEEVLEKRYVTGDQYAGIAKGRNVIILQMEAIQQFVIDLEIGGREVTPNLNRFIRGSVYFDNMYYQTAAGNTSDAEFITNTSLYPADKGAVYFRFDANRFNSIASSLKENGYSTMVFHANDALFWNRHEMYRNLGFDRFYNEEDYILDDIIGWGLSDSSFYMQSFEKIDFEKPFYSFFVALTSHFPYDFFKDYEFDVDGLEDELLVDYIKAANYADYAFGIFLDELRQRKLFDNSIILVYGDHQGIPKNQQASLEELFGREISSLEWIKLQKIPAMLYTKGIPPAVVSKAAGQIDFMPTIFNLLGISHETCLGKDLFNNEEGYALLRNGTLITDAFIYLSSENAVYDTEGRMLELGDYIDDIEDIQSELEASDLILEKDYFAGY